MGSTDLYKAQVLCIYKTAKIVVVYKDEKLIFIIFLVVLPGLENLDNSQKLVVVGLVLCLYRNHLFQKECYWISLAQISLSNYPIETSFRSQLTYHPTNSIPQYINFYPNVIFRIKMAKNQSFNKY